MHADHAPRSVGHKPKAVAYGMETRLTPGRHEAVGTETVVAAQPTPIVLLLAGQHEDDRHSGQSLAEAGDGVHQHRPAAYGDELLGQGGAHAQPLAPGHYYGIIVGHFASIS